MTTPTPMARAVEAMGDLPCCPHYHETQSDVEECENCGLAAQLRAALPALLEAVVGEMTDEVVASDLSLMAWWYNPVTFRAALLAALRNAAGRVG